MASQLTIYNAALRLVGERNLSTLTEGREARRLLDQVWEDDGKGYCLEAGKWKFAMRSVEIEYTPSIAPPHGYTRAFDKPTDFVRTCALCSDPYYTSPLLRYQDEAGYWFADLDQIYVRYVSDDTAYGNDLSLWPQSFLKFVEAHFAHEIVLKLTSDEKKWQLIYNLRERCLRDALSNDAMADPTRFPPMGSWVASRYGGNSGNDRGNPGSLIG